MSKKISISILCLILFIVLLYKPIENLLLPGPNQSILAKEESSLSPYHQKVIVFLGDSITVHGRWNEYFPKEITVNHGVSRNRTSDILWRLDPVIQNKPDKLFLMIGINDLIQEVPETTLIDNYKKIIRGIKEQSPKTTVYVQSILPVNTTMLKFPTAFSDKIIRMNTEIKKIALSAGYTYIDLNSVFSQENILPPELTSDGLHLTDEAYLKWKNEIVNHINE